MAKTTTPPSPTRLPLARPLYGPAHPKGPTVGPDVISVKRAVSRAFPKIFMWAEFDQTYNKRIQAAMRKIQGAHGIDATGQYGTMSHQLLRGLHRDGYSDQWAFDATAINLMKAKWDAIHDPPMSPEEMVKVAMVRFMRAALNAADGWHYSQERPISALGRDPSLAQNSDCSGGCSEVLFWARMVTKINVPDPMGRGWDGYGNTDWLWSNNSSRIVTGSYQIGDMGLYYGHGGHVIMCLEPGSDDSADWWSNGSERAPNTTKLHYRSDLRGVVRPKLIV